MMLTCCVRYEVDLDRLEEFERYARTWMHLVEKLGGIHHGYFLPWRGDAMPPMSFPGKGRAGKPNEALALFSFPSCADYETYRAKAAKDEECVAATKEFAASQCFSSYERSFLTPLGD